MNRRDSERLDSAVHEEGEDDEDDDDEQDETAALAPTPKFTSEVAEDETVAEEDNVAAKLFIFSLILEKTEERGRGCSGSIK